MYKVDIEECMKKINNKFELILKASSITRKIVNEENLTQAYKKKPVMKALKEIEETLTFK